MRLLNGSFGRIAIILAITFVAESLISGCYTSPRPPKKSIDSTTNPRATLVLGSRDLIDRIRISDAQLRPVGELTQAAVTVQNLTESRYTLEYKFDWSDADGFPVESLHTWHRFVLTPQQMQSFTSTGKTPKATRIIFTVRLPDDEFLANEPVEPTR